jgi:hypothetical protein
MLSEQESSIEQTLQEDLQDILSKINTSFASPTRKKPSIDQMIAQDKTDIPTDSTMSDVTNTPSESNKIINVINPYQKFSQQCRSVQLTLPTTPP